MESYARQAMTACGLNPDNLTVLRGVAEELPVDDNSQDVVVSTLVRLCVGGSGVCACHTQE